MNEYQQELENRSKKQLIRHLPEIDEGVDFFSNDYLGLSKSKELGELIAKKSARIEANGATGSRLLSGNSPEITELEKLIASFHSKEAALIYGSGYTANLGLLSSLGTKNTTFIMDELVHASLIDGARLGYAKRLRFRHNDIQDLEKKLSASSGERFVIIESIYSMDGDISPLAEVTSLCKQHDVKLIVDEAHGIGIFGNSGGGLIEEAGLNDEVFAQVLTYGKAPGIHGAAVVGPQWLKDYQVNFSRPFIFSTAPSPHQIVSIAAFYELVPQLRRERKDLQEIVKSFISKRRSHHGSWLDSPSQIQSLIVPGNDQVMQLSKKLKNAGINALPIRKPSVPEGTERIRFCLHSYNTKEEIIHLFDNL